MEIKKCAHCNKYFPKTLEFFFAKITKKDSKTGIKLCLLNDSHSFRHICKKCWVNRSKLKKQEKQAKIRGVSLQYYQENAKNYQIEACSKPKSHPEFAHLPNRSKEKRDAIKLKKLGMTKNEYEIHCKTIPKINGLKKRIHITKDEIYTPQLSRKRAWKALTKSTVANQLEISVRDLPESLYNLKKQQILLIRKLKENEKC